MPSTKLVQLLFAQGGRCFFCRETLGKTEASVEHLVATANGGKNSDENCVACCKSLNRLLGSMSLKEKVQVILNQKGRFLCPNRVSSPTGAHSKGNDTSVIPKEQRMALVIEDLRRRGAARPRRVKTLTSTIHALLKKELSEQELAAMLKEMQKSGFITISESKVTYALPPSSA